ncbi:hypothetical protein [Congregibacter sp.]|uniref:hypothetical protein n=1 Tax=Congregibacter sp. TaxID=2744308 RepID=UPI00385FE72E
MTNSEQPRFNLVFSGQLLPGTDIERAKRTLAAFFGLRDVSGVSVFFSGKPVPLRRNITKSDAQRLYRQLRGVGLICEISSVEPDIKPEETPPAAESRPKPKQKTEQKPKLTAKPQQPPKPTPAPAPAPENEPKSDSGSAPAALQPSGKAPNLFALRPAFPLQNRAQLLETTQIRGFIAAGVGLALCAVMLAVIVRFPAAPAGQKPLGALAGISLPGNELVLLVEGALLLHERSGLPKGRISAAELGFKRIAPPLWATQSGDLLLNAIAEEGQLRLQRCDLSELSCYPFSPEVLESPVTAIASSLLGDNFFFLGAEGQLWRSNSAGEIESEATVQPPWGQPRLLSSGGLLLAPAAEGPMLGVYRPDAQNFGQQLDALLVMPLEAVDKGQDRLRDVAIGEEEYWALMAGEEAPANLFQFDKQWGSPKPIALPAPLVEPYLIRWRDKVLVADTQQAQIQRVASDGSIEAVFESTLLTEERDNWIKVSQQRSLMRQLGIGLPMILIVFCASLALLYHFSYRSLQKCPQQRSALLDPMPGGIHWLPRSVRADAAIKRTSLILVALMFFLILLFATLGGWLWLLAGLPAAAGLLYASSKLREGSGGHLGLLDKHFISVDYDGRYFYGERTVMRGNAAVLVAPEVVLPIAIPGLANLESGSLDTERYSAKLKSTPSEIIGALWLSQHPWIKGVLAMIGGLLMSIGLLLIIG